MKLVIVLLFVINSCLADDPSGTAGGKRKEPQTVADCVKLLNAPHTSGKSDGKSAGKHTPSAAANDAMACYKKCFDNNPYKDCKKRDKDDGDKHEHAKPNATKAVAFQAKKQQLATCVTENCKSGKVNRSKDDHPKPPCGLLLIGKAMHESVDACLKTCHAAATAAASTSSSTSEQHPADGHHRDGGGKHGGHHHHSCVREFCTDDELSKCGVGKNETKKAAMEAKMSSMYTDACNCIKGKNASAITSLGITCDKQPQATDSVCVALYADLKKKFDERKAKHGKGGKA